METKILEQYRRWVEQAVIDQDVVNELKSMAGDETKIEDAFYRNLAFGTGGLRGTIGAGTNRMNVYTVAKASQGLSDYLLRTCPEKASVVIGYDSRIKSDVFAKTAASVFAANGVVVHLWPRLLPVPAVSYAARYLGTSAGVMITASHNPSKYNGYKVYGADGCQITTEAAAGILAEIEKLDIFGDVKRADFEESMTEGKIRYISDDVLTAFVEEVKGQSVLFGEEVKKDAAIVYSPLNGTGLEPVTRTLKELGYTNITVVKEQEQPDGNFPTCPYPNPEIKEAMALGMEYAKKCNADLLLATDPDCDRVGIAVKDKNGEYVLLSGNETGMLLLDYICSQRVKHGKMPADPVMIKTIVTMDMGEQIAKHYGVATKNVLTGFKFIGEQIGLLEKQGREDSYIFGFEESYGYLTGSYVRDKDAVNGACMICEMFSYYATKGISLLDKLNQLFAQYGYCLNTLHSYEFEGAAGFAKMQGIMKTFHEEVGEGLKIGSFAGKKIHTVLDYSKGLDGLPASDVLKYLLEGNCSVVVRPSGTEPKLKVYLSISAGSREEAEEVEKRIVDELKGYFIG
jgi:phosphoglucomutase